MTVGILLGLAAAFCISLSYLFGRLFIQNGHGTAVGLLLLSNVVMGVVSVGLLPLVWGDSMPGFGEYGWALFFCTLFYALGQMGLFLALKRTDASIVSPFLGLKVFILAAISAGMLGESFSGLQWGAVAMSVVAALMMNWSGKALPWQSAGWVMSACVCYSISDLSIRRLVGHFLHLGLTHGSVLGACLTYIVCGAVSGLLLCFRERVTAGVWARTVPYAVSWYVAMLFLYACFASVGVVFGNILQSTRGVFSVGLGAAVAAAGMEHLEEKISLPALVRRVLAAGLMTGAIAMFYLGG